MKWGLASHDIGINANRMLRDFEHIVHHSRNDMFTKGLTIP